MSVHEDKAAAQLAVAAPPGQAPRFFKLPHFWTASPVAWFWVAEAQFLLRSTHSWAQRKLSPLSPLNPLNILLSINGPLLSYGFNGLND